MTVVVCALCLFWCKRTSQKRTNGHYKKHTDVRSANEYELK